MRNFSMKKKPKNPTAWHFFSINRNKIKEEEEEEEEEDVRVGGAA